MSKKLGDIEYDTSEYLNLGSTYPEAKEINSAGKTELNIIDLNYNLEDEENAQEENEQDKETNDEDENEVIEKNEIEAEFVAKRIKKIFDDNYMVFDKKQGYRKATFKDIVILLRTTSNIARNISKKTRRARIPCF